MKRPTKAIFAVSGILLIFCTVIWRALVPPHIPVPKSEDRIISGIVLFNPGDPLVENQTIVIRDGIITEIRDTRIDDGLPICAGCFAMPGLIDAHIHTPPKLVIGNQRLFSLLYLKYGVTSVRDLGQFDDSIAGLASNLNQGKIVGPRMYRCGPILDGTPPIAPAPGAKLVLTFEDGAQAVRELAASGVDCIKVYTYLPASAFAGVSMEAERLGLPLIGHTPHAMKMSDITNFESQHYTGIPYLHRSPTNGWDYRTEDLMDMTPTEIMKVISVMRENNIAFLPTNANAVARLSVSDIARFPATEGFRHLPDLWAIAWPSIVSHPETDAEIEIQLKGMATTSSIARAAHLGGVDILVGTDVIMPYVIPGEALHLQLEILSDIFGSRQEALRAATQINGRHIDKGRIGHLKIGAYADILLLKRDPRADLDTLQDWEFLLVAGRLYTKDQIDLAVTRYDQHFHGVIYSTILRIVYLLLLSDQKHPGEK